MDDALPWHLREALGLTGQFTGAVTNHAACYWELKRPAYIKQRLNLKLEFTETTQTKWRRSKSRENAQQAWLVSEQQIHFQVTRGEFEFTVNSCAQRWMVDAAASEKFIFGLMLIKNTCQCLIEFVHSTALQCQLVISQGSYSLYSGMLTWLRPPAEVQREH